MPTSVSAINREMTATVKETAPPTSMARRAFTMRTGQCRLTIVGQRIFNFGRLLTGASADLDEPVQQTSERNAGRFMSLLHCLGEIPEAGEILLHRLQASGAAREIGMRPK